MNNFFLRINVIKHSKRELVLRINPILSYAFLLGFFVLAFLIFLFNITTTYSTTLSCQKLADKSENISCKLSSTSLSKIGSKQIIAFSNTTQAMIIEEYNKEIDTGEYFVALKTNEKEIVILRNPISYHYEEWQDKIEKINDFIVSNDISKLTFYDRNKDIVLAGFSIDLFLIIIIAIIWASKTVVTCTISLESKILLIKRKKMFNNQIENYSLENIKKAILETRDGIDKSTSRIAFKSNTGELIPMMSYYDSFSGKEEAVRYINQFIK